MSLVKTQNEFLQDVLKLVQYANEKGYIVTGGELYRIKEQQEIYVKTGKSKTMKSSHLNRLAIDLNFFTDKLELIQTPDEVGEYWESLNEKNRWGGSWRGLIKAKKSTFVDKPHFERQT